MKTFLEYLERMDEDGPGGSGPHGPSPMPHAGPATGLGVGFGPAGPRPMASPRPAPAFGLSFLTPLNTTLWTTPVWSLYSERWPNDRYGNLINQNLTFADLALALDLAISPYDAIGTDSPKVVKKILKILAEIIGRKYGEVRNYQPQAGLFTDHDAQIDKLSQKLGVLLAPIADRL